jgi:hypothetical protein
VWVDGGVKSAPGEKVSKTPRFPLQYSLMEISFWFLFPVANYGILPLEIASDPNKQLAETCFGCDIDFPDVRYPFPSYLPFDSLTEFRGFNMVVC